MDELLDRIRRAADQVGEPLFLEILGWHRAVVGLPALDPNAHGAYRDAIAELGDDRTAELLRDLRRLARNPRRYRNGADGKPRYRQGRTVSDHHHRE
ncbi:hypothetical protein [Dietzia sp. PP-33]|uniref:hypothetical protein n=1 Tax=Dietzia sp. PP-33 TaxID=2957500 RepID=UPI0029BEBE6D|nr:hypothetical protein [Dietzia sp. PP-33]MDX2359016.1 hypothetical protein [Dietzia sp. PP-33]